MFNIYKSNKMANLADALVSVLEEIPDHPMSPEWIGIQSRGMKQWIMMHTAKKLGVCTNKRFVFPRQMVDTILASCPHVKDRQYLDKGFDEALIFWSVMKLIQENRSQKALSSIKNYIKDDETGKKSYQLSMKISKVFDDYQVYRPHMLMDWQNHQLNEPLQDPVARWQSELWGKVISKESQNHLAFKATHFLEKLSIRNIDKDNIPSRMSLFGISALPQLFLEVFEKVSELIDINLFLLTPSNQFFFDIKSERHIAKIILKEKSSLAPENLYYEMTNPLLSSLGTAGKRFHSCLEAFNYHEPYDDLFTEPIRESTKPETMLLYLQSDILNLVLRKKGQENTPVNIAESDTSVGIHACHSPMREAQVLKDLLLNEFKKDPELIPDDIIVMMPDIESYAPFIDSVFGRETILPFSISDRRKRSESEFLDAFLKVLGLRNTRFDKKQILDLLLSESISKQFNISMDDIQYIEKMVMDAQILWGKDGYHRQEAFGLPAFEENTWEFGLQRLFMGMAMPENYEELVKDILPCQSLEGLDLEVLGKFAAFCDTLFSCFKTLTGKQTIEAWCDTLKLLSSSLMDRNSNNKEDQVFLNQTIEDLRENAKKSEFRDLISFDVIHALIENRFDQNISQGNFLTGKLTFCNIMPMRSIPFKIVVLMGMDEKSFPRQDFTPGFDLIKKYPKPFDKILRDEDRYLFLETLLSARLKLIITYTGMSIQDNSKIPCSGVVSELADTMDQSFIFPDGNAYHVFHPLHPFNESYFNRSGSLYSFSNDNCSIARALNKNTSEKTGQKKPKFVQGSTSSDSTEPESTELSPSAAVDEIIRFFKNPVKGYMQEGLNIKIPDMEVQTIDREVFSLSGLDQYSLGSLLVKKNMQSSLKTQSYPILKAMGALPFGTKGKFEYEKIANAAGPVIDMAKTIAAKKIFPSISFEINVEGVNVLSNFSDIREDGVYFLSFGKLNGARLLSGWIKHLCLNIGAPENYPKKTFLIGRDPKGKEPIVTIFFPALESDAYNYFKELVHIYVKGIKQPFYFFCETSWQFAQALLNQHVEPDMLKPDRDLVFKAMNKSKPNWYGGYYREGEKENRYISLCVGDNDPFESVDTLISSGFGQNAITVYKPLLENLKIIS